MRYSVRFVFLVAGLAVSMRSASAHFKLLEPASWLIESDRGDPQKAGPCGGSNTDWGKPSYDISKAVGGQKLHLKIQETVYHPGHYRVALAVNSPNELPLDPQVTTRDSERGPWSVSAAIQNLPQIPVLADGLFVQVSLQRVALGRANDELVEDVPAVRRLDRQRHRDVNPRVAELRDADVY